MMQSDLKIGIIGLSDGNGHPYSWSTIFNGYSPEQIATSSFPNIEAYLKKQKFPDDQIKGANVTHVWTQAPALSQHIADTCFIEKACFNYLDFIGEVDAVILARDDCENHMEVARPFLEAGLPIFIDKPLAHSTSQANKFFELEQYEGQIFTCSALRYAAEFFPTEEELDNIGKINRIEGSTVKSWEKYAIHLIEPVVAFIGEDNFPLKTRKLRRNDCITVDVEWNNGMTTSFQALGPTVKKGSISITYHGDNGSIRKEFNDAFAAFKIALNTFVESVRSKSRYISKKETLKIIQLVEAGLSDDIS